MTTDYDPNLKPVWADIDHYFTDQTLYLFVQLQDGRLIGTPLSWYPVLDKAGLANCRKIELLQDGLHWPDLDEHLSIEGMLAGRRAVDKKMTVEEIAHLLDVTAQDVVVTVIDEEIPHELNDEGEIWFVLRSDYWLREAGVLSVEDNDET